MSQLLKGHPDTALFHSFCNDSAMVQKEIFSAFPLVRTMVCRNNGDEEDAKEIFQEALVGLWNYCKNNDFVLTVPLQKLLCSIARNCWLKHLKKNKQNPVTFFESW
ncbi:MAG: hypothetical protein AAB316_21000, partial [Bacteroidota bacterium]